MTAPETSESPVRPERSAAPTIAAAGLRREVSLPLLVLYGLGTTVGAGIYALTGEVAGEAGMAAPAAFVVAAALAGLTGLGFAELAGRLPKAAGEAVFVDRAFGRDRVTLVVGLLVLTAGVVAASTVSVAFGGYVSTLVDIPTWALILGLVVVLGGIAVSGVSESVGSAAVVTGVELLGLILVLWSARSTFGDVGPRLDELAGFGTGASITGILGGAFLAFFAFLGFEDIDAVAEETIDAPVTLPKAILVTLAITTVLYVLVSSVAVLTVEPAVLSQSDAPLATVFAAGGGRESILASFAAIAMVNGVLVQLVMVPRVVYGLTRLGLLPDWAGRVSTRTGTPVLATLAAVGIVGLLSQTVDLEALARVTSGATMGVFIAVNVALIVIKRKDGPTTTFQVPAWLPWVGTIASVGMFVAEINAQFFG